MIYKRYRIVQGEVNHDYYDKKLKELIVGMTMSDYLAKLRAACLVVIEDGITLELNGSKCFLDGEGDDGSTVYTVRTEDGKYHNFPSAALALDFFYPSVMDE